MDSFFWVEHQHSLIVFCSVLLVIMASNLLVLHYLGSYRLPSRYPRVSILVPARNEERNIETCLRSLLGQDYPHFEVLVLDDHSTDRTADIVRSLTADERLRLLTGQPLPPGWLGKHWACHQLAQAASGELLLFTDADTRHHPHALRLAVAAIEAERADLLTLFVKEDVVSWGERLIIPVITWSVFSFLPLILAYLLPVAALSAASGQFMLFRRRAYETIGGHASVRDDTVDDVALGRRVKTHRLRWRMANGADHVRCRMYHSAQEVFDGFGKNLFGVFQYNVTVFVLIWAWVGIVFLEPPIVVTLALAGALPAPFSALPALQAMALAVVLWAVCLWRFRFPLYLAVLYPVTISLTIVIAARSLVLALAGRAVWKGRCIPRPPIRWL